MSGKLMPVLVGPPAQSIPTRVKYPRPALSRLPAPETSMSSLLEILVVLGLTLALGTVCRIMRVREDCAEACTDHYDELSSRCLSIIRALQDDCTVPLPARTLLHALSFVFSRLNPMDSATTPKETSSLPSGGSCSGTVVTADCVQPRNLGAAATRGPGSAQPIITSPEADALDSADECEESKTGKLSKAARRRRNRKARLAPYLKPASQTIDSPMP